MNIKLFPDLHRGVIYSEISKKAYDLVSKAAPETLCLTSVANGEPSLDFQVKYVPDSDALSKFGVIFGGVSMNGDLIATFPLCESATTVEAMKSCAAEKILPIQMKLQQVERAVVGKSAEIAAAQAGIVAGIVID